MNRYDIVLDLDKSRSYRRYGQVVLRQGESEACQIAATITDHDEAIEPEGLTPYLTAQLPSGDYYRQTGEWEDGVAVVTVDESRFASEIGRALMAYFEIRDGDELIATTQDFPLKTIAEATANGEVLEPYDSLIEDAVAKANDATDRVNAALEELDGRFVIVTDEQIDELFGQVG